MVCQSNGSLWNNQLYIFLFHTLLGFFFFLSLAFVKDVHSAASVGVKIIHCFQSHALSYCLVVSVSQIH